MGGGLGTGLEPAAPRVTFRPAGPADLPVCATIWRAAINDYIGRLGQAEIPSETHPVTRLFVHLQATDPERFVVACVPQEHRRAGDAADGERIVAFGSAVVRERVWYLSMLFVLPEFQGAGLGRDCWLVCSPPTTAWPGRPPPTASSRSRMRCTRRSASFRACRC